LAAAEAKGVHLKRNLAQALAQAQEHEARADREVVRANAQTERCGQLEAALHKKEAALAASQLQGVQQTAKLTAKLRASALVRCGLLYFRAFRSSPLVFINPLITFTRASFSFLLNATLCLLVVTSFLYTCYQARKEADRAAADAAATAAATAGEERGALRQKLEATLEAHEVALAAAKQEAQALTSEVEARHQAAVTKLEDELTASGLSHAAEVSALNARLQSAQGAQAQALAAVEEAKSVAEAEVKAEVARLVEQEQELTTRVETTLSEKAELMASLEAKTSEAETQQGLLDEANEKLEVLMASATQQAQELAELRTQLEDTETQAKDALAAAQADAENAIAELTEEVCVGTMWSCLFILFQAHIYFEHALFFFGLFEFVLFSSFLY